MYLHVYKLYNIMFLEMCSMPSHYTLYIIIIHVQCQILQSSLVLLSVLGMLHCMMASGLLAWKYAVTLSPDTDGVLLKNLIARGGRTVFENR